jgi:hypothetical protein
MQGEESLPRAIASTFPDCDCGVQRQILQPKGLPEGKRPMQRLLEVHNYSCDCPVSTPDRYATPSPPPSNRNGASQASRGQGTAWRGALARHVPGRGSGAAACFFVVCRGRAAPLRAGPSAFVSRARQTSPASKSRDTQASKPRDTHDRTCFLRVSCETFMFVYGFSRRVPSGSQSCKNAPVALIVGVGPTSIGPISLRQDTFHSYIMRLRPRVRP